MKLNKTLLGLAVLSLIASTALTAKNKEEVEKIDTIGKKNKNPLNIKGKGWQGQTGSDSQGHAIFSSYIYGTRASLINLKKYIDNGFNTIAKITARWAVDNTGNYANYVSQKSKINKDTVIAFEKEVIRKIMYYMSLWESKHNLTKEEFDEAFRLL
jgi:hypothetical protein